MNNFKEYLAQKGEAINTVRTRINAVNQLKEWLGTQLIEKTTYADLMDYVKWCSSQGNKTRTIRLKLKSLSHYFDYLINSGNATQNPAKLVQLKGVTKTLPSKLLTEEELTEIYALQTTFGLIEKRDKVLLSLAIFQGVGSKELALIEVTDVDLMSGTIYVPALRTTNSRTLELKPWQLLLFQDYLINVRSFILQKAGKQSNFFLINQGAAQGSLTNVISRLIKKLRFECPKLRDLQQIRQSVMTNWIKQHGIRKAQYMAGHKYVSSTERYNNDKLEGLKSEIKVCYVLK